MDLNTSSTYLLPPLDDGEDGSDAISPDLKSKFEKLRALLPSSEEQISTQTPSAATHGDRKRKHCLSTDRDTNNKESKHKKSEEESKVRPERLELATQTYAAIENEISIMCKGILELEALLEISSENNDVVENVDKVSGQ